MSAFAVPEIVCLRKHGTDTDAKLLPVNVKTVLSAIGLSTPITQSVEEFFFDSVCSGFASCLLGARNRLDIGRFWLPTFL